MCEFVCVLFVIILNLPSFYYWGGGSKEILIQFEVRANVMINSL